MQFLKDKFTQKSADIWLSTKHFLTSKILVIFRVLTPCLNAYPNIWYMTSKIVFETFSQVKMSHSRWRRGEERRGEERRGEERRGEAKCSSPSTSLCWYSVTEGPKPLQEVPLHSTAMTTGSGIFWNLPLTSNRLDRPGGSGLRNTTRTPSGFVSNQKYSGSRCSA